MNSPSDDVREMLEAQSSLGLIFRTNLFVGREPSVPAECVTIYDTGAYAPGLTLDGLRYERPTIQIRVRDKSQMDGYALIQRIVAFLHGVNHETWNGSLYTVITCSSGPTLLEWDSNGFCKHIANFNLQRR